MTSALTSMKYNSMHLRWCWGLNPGLWLPRPSLWPLIYSPSNKQMNLNTGGTCEIQEIEKARFWELGLTPYPALVLFSGFGVEIGICSSFLCLYTHGLSEHMYSVTSCVKTPSRLHWDSPIPEYKLFYYFIWNVLVLDKISGSSGTFEFTV